ncbi:UvrD-helicase domain-containing protein [Chitinophagaceae bacterium MMS25-I14]
MKEHISLEILKASAGSGKTFNLTLRYLQLLLDKPYKYKEILAVTFTNKATEEMKSRILEVLEGIARGEENGYTQWLQVQLPGLKGGLLQQQADEVYRNILHDYSRFAVTTIDKFVQRVIRSFAFEIGLDAGYKIEMNTDKVKEDLADRMYALLDTDERLRRWVLDLAMQRVDDNKGWDFTAEMLQLATEIFKERFFSFEESLKLMDDPQDAFKRFQDNLYRQVRSFEEDMKAIAATGIAALEAGGVSLDDFPYKRSSFAAYLYNISEDKFEPGKRTLDAINDISKWYSKTTAQGIIGRIETIYPAVNSALENLAATWREQGAAYTSARLILSNLYYLNLLRVLAGQLGNYRAENNTLLISDTHQLLRMLVQQNDAPFIFEKMGNQYHHLLIDEFQDTSSFQWTNFRPLMQNAMASGYYNLIVGDVKQAIYRWRNGDWRLLLYKAKQDMGLENTKEGTLQENYRSHKNIIRFNNYIFHTVPKLLQQQFNQVISEIGDSSLRKKLEDAGLTNMIQLAYEDSYQEIPERAPEGGVVRMDFIPIEDSKSTRRLLKETVNEHLPIQIDYLLREKKYQPSQIAILTRTNTDAKELIALLMQFQQQNPQTAQYTLISSDALLIGNAPSVKLLLTALLVLAYEHNPVAKAQLIQQFALHKGFDINDDRLYRKADQKEIGKAMLPETFTARFRYWQTLTVTDLIPQLTDIFELHEDESQQAYLLAFSDLVLEFAANGNTSIQAFLDWWHEDGYRKALQSASGANAIELMTIHRSKGLAFDIVLMPYCYWELNDMTDHLWCDTSMLGDGSISVVPVNTKKEMAQSIFAYDYYEEKLFAWMDALNLLYVAFTRAREALWIWAPQNKKTEEIKHTGDMMLRAVRAEGTLPDQIVPVQEYYRPEENLFLYGDFETQKTSDELNKDDDFRILRSSGERLINELRENTSDDEGLTLGITTLSDIQRSGILTHQVLASIRTVEDVDPVMHRMILEGRMRHEELEGIKIMVGKITTHEQTQDWFSGRYKAINEKNILLPGGAMRRPDKVLVSETETILVDFKFSRKREQQHARQLLEYTALLEQMGYRNIQSYIWYSEDQKLVPTSSITQQGKLFF